jgi:hypothetical protein
MHLQLVYYDHIISFFVKNLSGRKFWKAGDSCAFYLVEPTFLFFLENLSTFETK